MLTVIINCGCQRLHAVKLLLCYAENAMSQKGGFKNIKLGKNVYRQMKRRGPPKRFPFRPQNPPPPKKKTETGT
jgi:hypothetical protein